MNQKSYSLFLCSLLMASYSVYGASKIDDLLHNPFEVPTMVSQDEHEEENNNKEWSEKYASRIARYFFNRDYDRITEEELSDYLDSHRQVDDESKNINFEYMLGVVNGLLEKMEIEHKVGMVTRSFSEDKELSNIKDFDTVIARAMKLFGGLKSKFAQQLKRLPREEKDKILTEINAVLKKQPVDKSSQQFNDNLQRIIDSLKKDGREEITGFSEILKRAKDLKLSDYFISQLEKLSDREKSNLFLMVDMSLPTKAEVANALELARAAHIEDQKQRSRDRELDVRRDQEKQKEVARALDLARLVKQESEKAEKDFNKYVKEHNIETPEELKKYALSKLKPSILKLIDRDVELSTVTKNNLGDIQDITKEELIEQAKKDGIDNYLLKNLNLLDESDIHDLIHEIIEQDRVSESLDLARAIVKNKKDRGSDSDRDMMKPGYESGSDDEDFDDNDEKLSGGLFGLDDKDNSVPYSGKDGMLSNTVVSKNADEQDEDLGEDEDSQNADEQDLGQKEEPVAPPALPNADEQQDLEDIVNPGAIADGNF